MLTMLQSGAVFASMVHYVLKYEQKRHCSF